MTTAFAFPTMMLIGTMFNIVNIALLVLIIYILIMLVKVLRKADKALDIYLRNNDNNHNEIR